MALLAIVGGNALYLCYTLCCILRHHLVEQIQSGAFENAGWYPLTSIFQATFCFIYSKMAIYNLTYFANYNKENAQSIM